MSLPTPKPPTADGNPPEYDAMKDLAKRCAASEKLISLASAKILEWISKEQVQRERAMKAEAELERVQKQTAAMREALKCVINHCVHPDSAVRAVMVDLTPIRTALQLDAGSDYIHKDKAQSQLDAMAAVVKSAYVHKDQVKPLVEALTRINEISVIDEDMGCAVNWAGDALDHAKSIGL